MIRKMKNSDIEKVIEIWLHTNIKTHHFISREYWEGNVSVLNNVLPQSEIYVYEDSETNRLLGFVGIVENYVAGIFVLDKAQSQGIGKQLLDFVKTLKNSLNVKVYVKNERAFKFYKREQFRVQCVKIDEDNGEEEYDMLWEI